MRNRLFRRTGPGLLLALGAAGWLVGCAANEPFDPLSVQNVRPTVRMFVTAPPGGEFPATSYFERTFHWSGSDQDGFITGYDVSIRLRRGEAAPWVTTTRTDTLMTFVTDDNGEAEATFLLVARDNRGALSDTLREFFPLRNFPPEIFFDPDFDPLANLQRDVRPASADTLYWNWGYGNFKLVASDQDGISTMDQFFRYTFADVEPAETFDEGDPLADPRTVWVKAPFINANDPTTGFRNFEVNAADLAVGQRSLTVSILDEGGSDARFVYTWEVRAPRSNILYIRDNSSSFGRECYTEFLDARFGAGNWDTYDFWKGYPDRHSVLAAVMRKYEAVLWSDGGVHSDLLVKASERNGALERYVFGTGGAVPGKFVMVSSVLAGTTSRLGANFRLSGLGLDARGDPVSALTLKAGTQALGQAPGLLPMTSTTTSAKGIGLKTIGTGEILYRMEECLRCYNSRPPNDPIIAVRTPLRATSALARTVAIGAQLEYFNRAEVIAALNHLFTVELGVAAP